MTEYEYSLDYSLWACIYLNRWYDVTEQLANKELYLNGHNNSLAFRWYDSLLPLSRAELVNWRYFYLSGYTCKCNNFTLNLAVSSCALIKRLVTHLGGNIDGAMIMATLCLLIIFCSSCSTNLFMNEIIANNVNRFSTGNNSTNKFNTFSHSGKPTRKICVFYYRPHSSPRRALRFTYCATDRTNLSIRWSTSVPVNRAAVF